ncbi:MAG: hypothetical protein LC687_00285 [Actinobacteria bacterium]|nr:hypothetical protein [Actinomycetota bacterium]MCA1806308.1 hypothetical protein [Actinomycetota bacterium]
MTEEVKETKPKKKELDWEAAEDHLQVVEEQYLSLMGIPGVNVSFFFISVLPPIRGAFNQGIRDKDLYDRIMALK